MGLRMTEDEFRALGEEAPEWFKGEGDERMVHVAEYLYAEYETRTLVLLEDGTEAWKDDVADDAAIVGGLAGFGGYVLAWIGLSEVGLV